MRTLNFQGFKALRENAYAQAGIIGDVAERFAGLSTQLARAYNSSCETLDAIDQLGFELGYLDGETNEYIEVKE